MTIRRARADFAALLEQDYISAWDAVLIAEADPLLSTMRVTELLLALPCLDATTAAVITHQVGIAPSRRVRSLTARQRTALRATLTATT